jgi:hypothetical protein
MGTGGVKTWVKQAAEIADRLNRAIRIMDFEVGDGKDVPQLQQIADGKFEFKCFGKTWMIIINLKDKEV